MRALTRSILAILPASTTRLRYPALTAILAALLVVDLIVPDLVPLVDEIVLAVATAALASWRTERARSAPGQRPRRRHPASV